MEREERTYGIQAFDTPEEAFGLMAFRWTDRSNERMFVLNDWYWSLCRIRIRLD